MRALLPILAILPFVLSSALGEVRISEFVASNSDGLKDDFGDEPDWIEIYNDGVSPVDLDGWSLTDKSSNLGKWSFPAVTIAANGRMVIFASGRDRAIAGLPLHTNFSLSKGGEYLALVESDGTTIATEFSPEYPVQATDVSYGSEEGSATETVVALETPGRAGVPTSQAQFNSQFSGWNTNLSGAFSGSAWTAVNLGVGYETGTGTYGAWIGPGGDIQSRMFDVNPSAFIRVPFNVTDANQIVSASLRMRWDDGFAAFLNGAPVAADRNPSPANWDSISTTTRNDGLNDEQIYFDVDLSTASFNEGANLLAFQCFNRTVDSSDLLLQPELVVTRSFSVAGAPVYFLNPTPGESNGLGESELAPIFGEVTEVAEMAPTGSSGSPPLQVTAEVFEGTSEVQSVTAYHRTMFGAESAVVLVDDGTGVDLVAADGIYSGALPTSQVSEGEMFRWRFEAVDGNAKTRTSPPYLDPLDADQYYGTVANDPEVALANLPVLQTFVDDAAAVDTRSGDRVSLSYLGEFYDNVQMDLHGQSTAGPTFPKKSHDLDFNNGNRFKWREGERRVKDINLITNYADKSKVRNTLGYEFYREVGSGYHYSFPVRVERNGSFFSVVDLIEDGDDRYLDRLGLDDEGALYKIYDKLVNPNNSAKKTRKEEGTQDLQDFIDSIDTSLSTADLRRNAYDNIDIAATINHLVANQVIGITDTGHKNYYLYRDTEGSGEWRPLPWDVDLSFGHRWNNQDLYFDDDLITGLILFNTNPLWELIYTTPEFQDMWVRRFETMRRELFQSASPPVTTDWVRNRVIDVELSINPPGFSDADRDFNAWGSWGDMQNSSAASARIYNEWLPQHRGVIFGSNANLNGTFIPSTQAATPNVIIRSMDENPASGSQDEEYVILQNNSGASVDLSGWTLEGAIEYTFPAGTVILAGSGQSSSGYRGLLHIAKDAAAFRARAAGPTGNEFRYVQGGYSGQLSARGELLTLRNETGAFVDDFTVPSNPSPAQQFLRVSEISYHPTEPTSAELAVTPALNENDFEFIELVNTGSSPLVLDGASFDDGITFTFPVGTTLGAGERIILANNPNALSLRYPTLSVPVLGPYFGELSNSGERLQIVDRVGENVLDFSYSDHWYPPSDGEGSSLVLRDLATVYNAFDEPQTWGSSIEAEGSPGLAGGGFLIHFNGWQAENYLPEEQAFGQPGHPDDDSDDDGWSLWYEYALGMNPSLADAPRFTPEANGDAPGGQFGIRLARRRLTSDVQVELLSSTTLMNFTPVLGAGEVGSVVLGPELESVLVHDSMSFEDEEKNFYRLRISPVLIP
ncbi:MAG: lamin tail domain-containing protein [Roseibacillus sp.]